MKIALNNLQNEEEEIGKGGRERGGEGEGEEGRGGER